MMVAQLRVAGADMQIGRPEKLFDTRIGVTRGAVPAVENVSFAVPPDGPRFLITNQSATTNAEPLVVVMNWPALLRTRD